MALPKFWKSKTLLGKIETTYGTDPTPTGAANAILAMNVTFTPMEGEVVQRNIERTTFGALPFVAMAFRASISFEVDLAASGTAGTAPAWGPLMRACGAAEVITPTTSVEYAPITDNPESVGFYFDVDGVKHVMLGSRGTAVVRLGVNGNPVLAFTFMSLFTLPVDAAKPTPSYTSWKAPLAASKANTPTASIGGVPFVTRDFSLDLACQIEPRMLIGYEGVLLTGKEERVTMTVEAVPMATYNPYAIARDGTLQDIELGHGTVAGSIITIETPTAQQMPLGQLQQQQGILEWALTFVPQQVAGNDQWKITLT